MNVRDFKKKKQAHEKITVITCYDYPSARIVANTSMDCILVGDSVAMAVHGYPHTVSATVDMMVLHTQAVARGLGKQFLISDLPFLSYRISRKDTIFYVQRLFQAGAHAVKLEGGDPYACKTVSYLAQAGISVFGHIGLTPQSVHHLGGYGVQGKKDNQSQLLIEQAKNLEDAGCCAVIIECVPSKVAAAITGALSIPTIGIGAGPHTDGQVLVWHDVLGLNNAFVPRFVKQYARCQPIMEQALEQYVQDVQEQKYPLEA